MRDGNGERKVEVLHNDLRLGDTRADLFMRKHPTPIDVHFVHHLHVLTQHRDVLHAHLFDKEGGR